MEMDSFSTFDLIKLAIGSAFVWYINRNTKKSTGKTDALVEHSSDEIRFIKGELARSIKDQARLAREMDELRSLHIQGQIKIFDRLDKIEKAEEENAKTLRNLIARISTEWKDGVTVVKGTKQ